MRINPDNSILRGLTRIFDVIVVTVLFAVCCLPVFTIGASAAAMYATMIAIARDSCSSVTRCFFGSFRENFKLASLLWLLVAAVGLVVVADIAVCWGTDMEAGLALAAMRGMTVFCTALYTAMSIYIFSGIAVYRVTWKQAITNALILTMQKLPYTLGLVAVQTVMVAALMIVWFAVFPAVALGLYLQAVLLRGAFDLPREAAEHFEEEIDYG